MDVKYALLDAGSWLKQNSTLFIMLFVLMAPTIMYHALNANGIIPPFFIKHIAIRSWQHAIIGLGVGGLLGFALNKKFD